MINYLNTHTREVGEAGGREEERVREGEMGREKEREHNTPQTYRKLQGLDIKTSF